MSNIILPGHPRYQPRSLKPTFGYDNLYQTVAEVEIATLRTLGEIEVIPRHEMALLTPEVICKISEIPTTAVDKVEREITKHDVRAWIRLAQEILGPLAKWVHIPLTSYDPLDTGRIIQYIRAQTALEPLIDRLIGILISLVRKFANTLQIGRTHGQHALPITVGFWLATILNRILYNAKQMDSFSNGLVGKISGAVGCSNAQYGLGIAERCGSVSFEFRVLEKLNLQPAPISTQILPPEPLAYYLFSANMMSAALGQLGRDCRHLMRTEIAELSEPFEKGQVGSSTMAHKRNPINFEKAESFWLKNIGEFVKVLLGMISEHQRDLVGSALSRDYPIILVNLAEVLETLLRKKKNEGGETIPGSEFLSRISVDEASLRRNFHMSSGVILAEPIYIALQMAGYEHDAHHLVNHKAMPIAQDRRVNLIMAIESLAEEDGILADVLKRIPVDVMDLFNSPEKYTGNAEQKAHFIADLASTYLTDKEKAKQQN